VRERRKLIVRRRVRALLAVRPTKAEKWLPELLTDTELVAFYEAVWQARHPQHMVMLKLLLFTGLRNAELAHVQVQDVDLDHCQIHVVQGKGRKDRSVVFPIGFRGELAQYLQGPQARRAVYVSAYNRLRPYSTRRIRQIIRAYALEARIHKRVYPHLFRHQLITFLTRKGFMNPKLQLLSGHAEERNRPIYRELALADVSAEYEAAMQSFPVR
jgi:integrase/recombinase XerD